MTTEYVGNKISSDCYLFKLLFLYQIPPMLYNF